MPSESDNKAVKKPKIRRGIVSREMKVSSVDAMTGYSFQKEGNIIMNPLFMIGSKWESKVEEGGVTVLNRPGSAKFTVTSRGWAKNTVEIVGSAKYGVPSEFEYDVFHSILAIDAIRKKRDGGDTGVIEFIPADIINILGITDCWANYVRIDEAVSRLVETTYNFERAFKRSINYTDPSSIDSMNDVDKNDDYDQVAEFGEIKEVIATTEGDGTVSNTVTVALRGVKIFKPVLSITESDASGGVVSAKYRVEFDDFFSKNMAGGYRRYFDVSKHFRLKGVALKRFYEIISWQSYKHDEFTFDYDDLASRIPLNSGKMNKQYIIKYAGKLKEMGYIEDFDAKADKKSVTIRFSNKNASKTLNPSGNGESQASVWKEPIFSVEDGNVLKLNIRKLLNSRKISSPNEEEIFDLANDPEINVKRLDGDRICANVEYFLRRRNRVDSPMGFIIRAIGADYASTAKRSPKSGEPKTGPASGSGDDERPSVKSDQKTERRKAYREFMEGRTETEISELYVKYKIPPGASSSARDALLSSSLFSDWTLKL